jgi:phage shock protein A
MPVLELFVLRLLVWVGLPLLLLALVLGPARTRQLLRAPFAWMLDRRHEPTEVLNRVVKEQEKKIKALQQVLRQAETTQAEIARNKHKSEESITALEVEARVHASRGDDLGARAALSKLNLERLAVQGFQEQLAQQEARIVQTRRRLHLLELQLRQYEVGRSILLTQLAEAKTVEQQYALASQFDPLGAVAEWMKAEGTVQEATQSARAAEAVYQDTADLPLGGQPVRIDPQLVEAQLEDLKAQIAQGKKGRS